MRYLTIWIVVTLLCLAIGVGWWLVVGAGWVNGFFIGVGFGSAVAGHWFTKHGRVLIRPAITKPSDDLVDSRAP
jgi:TM2 domain-containing membrane protein YozV